MSNDLKGSDREIVRPEGSDFKVVQQQDSAKKSCVKAFVKFVNYQQLIPTRYPLNANLKDVVVADYRESKDKKVTACKESKNYWRRGLRLVRIVGSLLA